MVQSDDRPAHGREPRAHGTDIAGLTAMIEDKTETPEGRSEGRSDGECRRPRRWPSSWLPHPASSPGQAFSGSCSDRRLDRLDRRAGRARRRDDHRFLARQLLQRRLQRRDLLDRHDDGAVPVGVNEVAALHRHAVDVDVDAVVDDMHIGVRRRDRAGQELKTFGDHRNVAHAAVGDGAEAAERLVHVRLHLAPERAVAAVLAVEILDQHDAGTRRGGDVVEIVEALAHIRGVAQAERVLGLDGDGLGETDHRRQVGKGAVEMPDRVAAAAAPRRHHLDQIADGRRVDGSQKVELVPGDRGHRCLPHFRFQSIRLADHARAGAGDHATATMIAMIASMAITTATTNGQPHVSQNRPGTKAPTLPPA